jgi:hypothetical protein
MKHKNTSVSGKNYVLHVPRNDQQEKTFCGRLVKKVNCIAGNWDWRDEQICGSCYRNASHERTLASVANSDPREGEP